MTTGDYDDYAGQYAAYVAWREQAGPDADPPLPPLHAPGIPQALTQSAGPVG
jgi:hypothetical protein